MEKKYELIPSDKEDFYRIKALKNFANVKNGDIGGYVHGEENLSQEGNCWIYGDAMVCGNATVMGSAIVRGNAIVEENACVRGNACVCGNADIYGNAIICDNAVIYGNAIICDRANIGGKTIVGGYVIICGKARITELMVGEIIGEAEIVGDAVIDSFADYIVFKNWWSSDRYFTWTRSNNMWRVGCFYGTGDELIKKAYQDSPEKGIHYQEIVDYVENCVLKHTKKENIIKKIGKLWKRTGILCW